jgi:phospholipid/cholesterol/gamma-HCH transport system permease protein
VQVEHHTETGSVVLRAVGDWDIANAGALDAELTGLGRLGPRVVVDGSHLDHLDTAGAWLIHRTVTSLRAAGATVEVRGLGGAQEALLQRVAESDRPPLALSPRLRTGEMVGDLGRRTAGFLRSARHFVSFFGESTVVLLRTLLHPRRLRLTPLVWQMEQAGFNALPIVGLMSFLIGIVIAYQGAVQLESFGADVFVVDLIGLSVLREFGILLAAVMVAGRSGSAFTAHLGSMKIDEEVDALRTMGLDPMEVLVLPRVLGLVLTLPLVAFFADLAALLGGGLMAWASQDIAPRTFLERLREAVEPWDFWVGIVKAPVFAGVIGLVGCYQGLQVGGSSESLGLNTTRAVVESIFLVIVLDALFSIFFTLIGI